MDPVYKTQDLSLFSMPPGFRGKTAWFVQTWWLVQATLFRCSPQVLYGWRRFLLRLFGARVGRGVLVRPTAQVTFPWKLTIGDWSWIGDDVVLYSLGEIHIGSNSVISQQSYICGGSHDYMLKSFDIFSKTVNIESEVWIATGVFVGPGVTVGRGSVIGTRSVVLKDIPPGVICAGNPARIIGTRSIKANGSNESSL